MPGRDGTGPMGTGRGMGRGRKSGTRRVLLGPGGKCICPDCGKTIDHVRGIPCITVDCPDCGTKMTRQI